MSGYTYYTMEYSYAFTRIICLVVNEVNANIVLYRHRNNNNNIL